MRTHWFTPWFYVIPALATLMFFLIYPSMHTLVISFFGPQSEKFVGLANYIYCFTNETMLSAFRNNLLWVALFVPMTVFLGLILAVILDRVHYESLVKSIIFMPMAISFVGAGVIWKFVYSYRPVGSEQIGILNAFLSYIGVQPIPWLIQRPWLNNICLIIVGIWIWTGFCLVILSASYKGIPKELLEAARVDGANEYRIFWKIILPLMKPTVAVVATTMFINVLKVFDIVYVMTNGGFATEVIANRMYKEMFIFRNYGRASAIAILLLLFIIPMIIINVQRFREQEAVR
ncbi:MAG: sugar ABC transporter permease [Atribacterota bacterium]|jgi:alpha-glucoside transport system permease protein|nr:sugar ABC transporter permease [Atribacterota bacterium]MDD4897038.1 sugar ABC transporter permease [Atribacterota bacterium]MDD5637612.1 sugar ABC transporter permease [Atribacterota bacterium]